MLIVPASLNYSNNIGEEKEIILSSFQNIDQTAPVLPVRFFVVASELSPLSAFVRCCPRGVLMITADKQLCCRVIVDRSGEWTGVAGQRRWRCVRGAGCEGAERGKEQGNRARWGWRRFCIIKGQGPEKHGKRREGDPRAEQAGYTLLSQGLASKAHVRSPSHITR